MSNENQSNSRRKFLRGALAISLTPLLLSNQALLAQGGSKQDKSEVQYQDSPKNGQKCSQCRWFQQPDGCKVVNGKISPEGWCNLYMTG